MKVFFIVLLVAAMALFMGCITPEQQLALQKEYGVYNITIQNDSTELTPLMNEETALITKLNSATIFNRGQYESEYITWAGKYINKAELMQQHLNSFYSFLTENETNLRNLNIGVAKQKLAVDDAKITLRQDTERVNKNLQQFETQSEQSKALQNLLLKLLLGFA